MRRNLLSFRDWGQSNRLWTILFLTAFAFVTVMAIRTTIYTHQHRQDFTQQQTRRALRQLTQVWEQGVESQVNFWFNELKESEPKVVESQWQKTTPWFDGVYVWTDQQLIHPTETSFEESPCLNESPEWIDCTNESLDNQNRASLYKATHWLKKEDLSQAQFSILSARPRIQDPLSNHAISDAGKLDFILRQVRLYQTEQLGAPLNGGQSMLGTSLQLARQLPPILLGTLLEEIPQTSNPELRAQITRLQRHHVGWNAVEQILKDNPQNADMEIFTSSSIASDIVVIHGRLNNTQHVAITLDVPTLIDTFTNSNPTLTMLVIDPTIQSPTEDLIDVVGSKYFAHLRIAVPDVGSSEDLQSQLILTMSPIILAGILGVIALFGRFRADRKQSEFIQRQQAFIARVTHELKTPLAGIKLMSESLQLSPDLPEHSHTFIEKILAESERLERRIDEILQVAKRAEFSRPSRIDTEMLMLELYDQWQPRFQEVNGTLRLEILSEEIVVDSALIHDALSNLLSNAVKYRHPTKRLRCTFAMKRFGKILEISVADNGIGIPSHERKRIFERFVRIEGNHRGFSGGHGLGLAFVAETAKAHKGTVRCVDGIDGGSKIVMRLPVSPQ